MMNIGTKATAYFYVILASLHLCSLLLGVSFLVAITKVLLMPALLVYYLSTKSRSTFLFPLVFALFFSWAGDFLLIFSNEHPNFFLAGLCSFFMAHCAYITVFIKHGNSIKKDKWSLLLILFAVANLTLLLSLLLPYLEGDLLVPVIAYGSILSILLIASLYLRAKIAKYWLSLVLGILLFIFSDMLIAFRQFRSELIAFLPLVSFWIMSSYIIAQYLIVRAVSKITEKA